jgi:hypothetical protein
MAMSFQQNVLSRRSLETDDKLRALGGSDAVRAGRSEVWVRVHDAAPADGDVDGGGGGGVRRARDPIVGADEGHIVVRDPREPIEAPTSQSFRRFRVSGTFGPTAGQAEVQGTLAAPAVDWLVDGFSGSFVALGQVGMGKTHTLFGSRALGDRSGGLFGGVVDELFERVGEGESSGFVVGVSAWEVLNNDTYDLLAYPVEATPSTNPRFINVRVNTRTAATKVLERAHTNSQNWARAEGAERDEFSALPNVAHLFVRLTLIDAARRRCSTLHFVDLAGSHSLDRRLAPRAFQVTADTAKERRNINQHLLAFSRVVSEMAQAYEDAGSNAPGHTKLISARDSRLTQLLGPIMSHNARTTFLATVSTHREHYHDTVSTLRTSTRALHIACPCVPTTLMVSPEAMAQAATIGGHTGGSEELAEMLALAAGMVPLQQVLSARVIQEISHLDASASRFAEMSMSAAATTGAAVDPHGPRGDGPGATAAAGSMASGQSAGASDLSVQIETLRAYMAKTFPGSRDTLEAEVGSQQYDPTAQPSDQGTVVSSRFQREFQQVVAQMEQSDTQIYPATHKQEDMEVADRQLSSAGVGTAAQDAQPLEPEPEPEPRATSPGLPHPEPHPVKVQRAAPKSAADVVGRSDGREQEPLPGSDSMMRTNYESLLAVLRDVEHEKGRMAERIEELEHQAAEAQLSHELDMDTKQTELIEAQAKLRKATTSSGYGDIFKMYEHEIGLLQKEAVQLRDANVALERHLASYDTAGYPGPGDTVGSTGTKPRESVLASGQSKRAEMMARKLQRELDHCRTEMAQLKKKERLFALHQKGFDDANRKIDKLSRELDARKSQIESDALVIRNYERRMNESNAVAADSGAREDQMHEVSVKSSKTPRSLSPGHWRSDAYGHICLRIARRTMTRSRRTRSCGSG